MPDRFFLNALDPDKHTLEVPGAGKWRSENTEKFLVRYAGDIKLGELKDPRVVHSVPSVYARPIQFYQALRGRHPLHDAVVSQWRGLLAVFALQSWLKLTPTATEYRVPSAPTTSPSTGGTGGVGDLHITIILREQLPHPASDWERWWLLYCDGQLIGATSPWTVVYTPAEYRCPDTIPWQRDGLLIDPIDYYDPDHHDPDKKTRRSYELALLLRWVELVQAQHEVDRWGIADQMAGAINRELEEWETALRGYRDPVISVPALAAHPLVSDAPYRHFLLPPQVPGAPPVSDLILNASKNVTDTLVFSRSGLDQKKRVYEAVFVDQVDLAKLPGPTGEGGWRAKNNREIPLPYVIAEEAFFPPKLAELNLSDKMLVRGTNKLAIPLTPLFFKYFNHNDLTDKGGMLTVSETPQDVIVRLRLPWVGGEELTVEKTYDRNTDIVKVSGVTPALAVWPDFYAEDWLENFAIYSASPGTNLQVAPVLGDGTVLTRTTNQNQDLPFLWPSRMPPIGFALFHRETSSGKSIEVGLALRWELPSPISPDPSRTWRVAVDFGTSNTHVVMDDGIGYNPLPLRGRTTMLTEAEAGLKYIAGSCLYPDSDVETPFVTLLTQGNATEPTVGGDKWQTAVRYNPRFLFSPDQAKDIQQFVHNVKWGSKGGGADDTQLKAYLSGVVRYIACEARAAGVSKLSFAWSYPLALPKGVIAGMESFWKNVGASFYGPGAMTITAAEGCSESDAICRHLAAISPAVLPVHAKALSIAVDVGGGSSDVGFWTETKLKDRVSVKLAGNDLLPPLCSLKGFVPELYKICSGGALYKGQFNTLFNERPAIMFNKLLIHAKDASGKPCGFGDPRNQPVAKALFVGTGSPSYGEPPWLFVRSLIYLFFSGIAFYLGLHARKLITGMSEINLYFGGMGSSLLTWIIGDVRKIEEILTSGFREGLVRDEPSNKSVNIRVFSPAIDYSRSRPPKEEVAIGLLSPSLGGQGGAVVAGPQDTTILGEVGWADSSGKQLDWDANLTAEEIYNLTPPPNHDSGYMAQFIKNVLPKYVEELSLDEQIGQLQVESARVEEYLRRFAIAADKVLQSVFTCELKTVMEQYVSMALKS